MAYPALDSLLDHFVRRVCGVLADNLVGAYLQGSFALGDYDEHSDVDFIVVMREDIAGAQVPALNALHASIHGLPPPWSHRLEGSYVPAALLQRLPSNPRERLLFLEHGARSLA